MIIAYVGGAQNAMDWVQIGSTFGIPVLLLLAGGYFAAHYAWPYAKTLIDRMLTRMDRMEDEHRAERDKMLGVMNQLSQGFMNTTNAINATTAALNKLTDAVEELHEERKRPR